MPPTHWPHSRTDTDSAAKPPPMSLKPSLTEIVLLVLLIGVIGYALLPSVVLMQYADPLREESDEALEAHVADDSLPTEVRLRALELLDQRNGSDAAVKVALRAVRSASVARSDEGQALLGFVAQRPAAAAAGDVLVAWLEGRVPDTTWREQFLPGGWADAAVWTAVPLLWASEPETHEAQLMWLADVLGHSVEQQRIAVPLFADEEQGTLSYQVPAEALLNYVQRYLADTPPRRMRPTLEVRFFENLERTPRYLAAEAARLAELCVASERLPSQDEHDVAPDTYASAVLSLAAKTMPAQQYQAWLNQVATAGGPYATYAATAARQSE